MTKAEGIIHKIFELDTQYQGNVIKARNRIDFIRTYLCPLIDAALEAARAEGRIRGFQEGEDAGRAL